MITIKTFIAAVIAVILYIVTLGIVGFSIFYDAKANPATGKMDRPNLSYMWYMWIPCIGAVVSSYICVMSWPDD